jgi:hypothetical protein
MKLDLDTINYINTVVKTAKMIGIDNIIIEPNTVRAMDDNKTVIILQTSNVPDMPFGSIGLNRIDVFQSRYEIAKVQDNFTMEAIMDDSGNFARSLLMKGKGIKIDYRSANPSIITAPKQIKDTALHRVQLSGEAVLLLQKGQVAMGADQVTICSNSGVSFEFVDINNDVFKHTFADDAESLDGESDTSFVHRYPAKTLLSLFKHNPTGTFDVGRAGTLQFELNGLNVTVLPQV